MTKRAKKPKTEMTTIAQWGKDESSLLFWTLPVGLNDEELESVAVDESEVEDMVESIELAYVVSVMAYFR